MQDNKLLFTKHRRHKNQTRSFSGDMAIDLLATLALLLIAMPIASDFNQC